jgi:hypothetical protein
MTRTCATISSARLVRTAIMLALATAFLGPGAATAPQAVGDIVPLDRDDPGCRFSL